MNITKFCPMCGCSDFITSIMITGTANVSFVDDPEEDTIDDWTAENPNLHHVLEPSAPLSCQDCGWSGPQSALADHPKEEEEGEEDSDEDEEAEEEE